MRYAKSSSPLRPKIMSKRLREESPTRYGLSSSNMAESSKKPGISAQDTKIVYKCSLPPHNETIKFASYEDFDVHYLKAHAHRCPECRKNFPTEHFLGLHIEENHDPMVEARKAKGEKTYRCFVEGCDKICVDTHKRRMHLVDKHMFPKKYVFDVVDTGIDGKHSMLRWKPRKPRPKPQQPQPSQQTPGASVPMDEDEQASSESEDTPKEKIQSKKDTVHTDNDIKVLTSSMSSLKFVPPSVRFGRGGRRGGLSRS